MQINKKKVKPIDNHGLKEPIVLYHQRYYKYNPKKELHEQIANFRFKSEIMIVDEEESLRGITFVVEEKETEMMMVSTDVFNNRTKFINFLERIGNYFFHGSDRDLMYIKEMEFSNSKTYHGINIIGYYKKIDAFVFANGIMRGNQFSIPNDMGIIGKFYIAASAKSNSGKVEFQSQRKFIFKNGSEHTLQSWINALKSCYGEYKAIIGFSFILASICFDYIGKKLSFFPLLNLVGQPGSGKTSFARVLLGLFSSNPEVVMLSSVSVNGFLRKMEQTVNIPVILDEFSNQLKPYYHEALKNIFDLTGKVIGIKSTDSKTKQFRILSPAIIAGQQAPTSNEALMTRVISLDFAPIESDPVSETAYNKLVIEQEKGLGGVLMELFQYRHLIITHFETEYNLAIEGLQSTVSELRNLGEKNLQPDTRLIKNYGCLLAVSSIAIKYGNLQLLDDYSGNTSIERLTNKLVINGVSNQAKDEAENDEVFLFWELLDAMTMDNRMKKGQDYIVDQESDKLFINNRVFLEYQKYGRDTQGHMVIDKNTLFKYFKHKTYSLGPGKAYIGSSESGGRKQVRGQYFRLSSIRSLGFDF